MEIVGIGSKAHIPNGEVETISAVETDSALLLAVVGCLV